MAKHFKEDKSKKNTKLFVLTVFVMVIILALLLSTKNIKNIKVKNNDTNNTNKIKNGEPETVKDVKFYEKTIKGEKLVLKNKNDYNKVTIFEFDNGQIKQIYIYEVFENNEKYEEAKEKYQKSKIFELIKLDDNTLLIEVKRINVGDDIDLSYEEIYDKYLVKIIGAYEIVE